MKPFFVCLGVLMIVACTSEKVRIEEATEDFCSKIHKDTAITLSQQLAPFSDQMKTKTGVYVLELGEEAMVSRAWLSEYAEQTIDVQYFIFSTDNVGLIGADYLVRAAERGVKVRILVDDIMVDATGKELLKLDLQENLSIKIYNPTANVGKNLIDKVYNLITDFNGVNQRMHNKTFTVDGKVVITGGRNVADEYFDYDREYNFRDRDVLLIGGVSSEIQESFNQFWEDSLSIPVKDLTEKSEDLNANFENLHQYACDSNNFWPQIRKKITELPKAFKRIRESGMLQWVDSVVYVSDKPGKNKGAEMVGTGGASTDALIKIVQRAKKTIVIQTPYLVTTELSWDLFKAAIDRGVDVKILTNSLASTDNLEAFNGYQRDRETLLKIGIRIFEFKPDAEIRKKLMRGSVQQEMNYTPKFGLHAKSMVIDDYYTIIGTFNLDPRSANLNTECIAIIPSKEIAAGVLRGMNEEFRPENAWETTLDWNPDSEAGKLRQVEVKTRRIVPKNIL